MAALLRYTGYLRSLGAPIGRLLACARIPAKLLEHPAAAVPMESALQFLELASRSLGTEHLGLHVGRARLLDDLGPYGRMLERSLTVEEYIRRGIAFYNSLVTGQRVWLSEHGEALRINISTLGDIGVASYQAQMDTMVVTIAKIREAAGRNWSPGEISLAYRTRERLPDIDIFAGSRIRRGVGKTYFTVPRALLASHFSRGGSGGGSEIPGSSDERPLPESLGDLVGLQIENLLAARESQIASIAESLAMSARSLQRRLAEQGFTYSRVLKETRLRLAADALKSTDKPISEIAFDLGYTDSSNFTRAFRGKTGVSPQVFRDSAGGIAGRRQ
jgi:AraC-like DNA-binding protein